MHVGRIDAEVCLPLIQKVVFRQADMALGRRLREQVQQAGPQTIGILNDTVFADRGDEAIRYSMASVTLL